MEPASSTGTSRARPAAGLRRAATFGVAAAFTFAAVATGIVSLGAYCVTTDGGDLRAVSAAREAAMGSADTSTGAAAGFPRPSTVADAGSRVADGRPADTRTPGSFLVPPIDSRAHPNLRTATFALG